ncbi:MAG: hypothetical protein KHX35_10630, partial [Sutterella wadsworthensis]|nr:hypothetical protein [Sutterella wadsworthensis]
MRESKAWRNARNMPQGKARSKAFATVQKSYELSEFGLVTVANNHRKASGRNHIGAHEAQNIGKTVWRALERYMFHDAGRPRFKSFKQGINSIEGSDNREIMFKPDSKTIVWRQHKLKIMMPETAYFKEALAPNKRVKFCRVIRRTLKGKKRWYV